MPKSYNHLKNELNQVKRDLDYYPAESKEFNNALDEYGRITKEMTEAKNEIKEIRLNVGNYEGETMVSPKAFKPFLWVSIIMLCFSICYWVIIPQPMARMMFTISAAICYLMYYFGYLKRTQ